MDLHGQGCSPVGASRGRLQESQRRAQCGGCISCIRDIQNASAGQGSRRECQQVGLGAGRSAPDPSLWLQSLAVAFRGLGQLEDGHLRPSPGQRAPPEKRGPLPPRGRWRASVPLGLLAVCRCHWCGRTWQTPCRSSGPGRAGPRGLEFWIPQKEGAPGPGPAAYRVLNHKSPLKQLYIE